MKFLHVIHLPLGGGRFAKVDSDCAPEIWQQKWSANEKSPGRIYAFRTARLSEGLKKSHVALHSAVANANSREVDHINGDTLDDCRENLRRCAHRENGRNLPKWKSPTSSRYKGVCARPNGKWQAYIVLKGKQKYLGLFETEECAARAYDTAAKELFGAFRRLNFPE